MAFPSSPSNNQVVTVNNISYIYSSASNSWTRRTVGNIVVGSTQDTTAANIGALVIPNGGASITGNLYVGTNLYIGPSSFATALTTPTIVAVDAGSTYAQLAMKNTSGTGSSDFAAYADNGVDSGGWVDMGIAGSTFSDPNYTITKPQDGYLITRPTSNSYGGNLVIGTSDAGSYDDIVFGVSGFFANAEVARFHGNATTSGYFALKQGTASTSTTSGALQVTGGVGISGQLYAGGLNTSGGSVLGTATATNFSSANINNSNGAFTTLTSTNFSTGNASISGGNSAWTTQTATNFSSANAKITGGTISIAGVISTTNSTVATSTSTGALVVTGGVGIGANLYVGGSNGTALVHTGNIIPSANSSYNLGSTSNWYGTFYGLSTQAKYADLAEIYTTDSSYEAGTVVVFGGTAEITATTITHDTRVAGVISTNPAYLMNSESNGLPVAFTGRVPCKVRGPVMKGDVLVTSAYKLYAEKIDYSLYKPGCILGKALGDVAENEFATIEVVVGRF